MKIGAYVSGAGHLGILAWLMIGGFFVVRDDFDAVTVTDVSIISEDLFDASQSSPETAQAPDALTTPELSEAAPALTQDIRPQTPDRPDAVAAVTPDATPEPLVQPEQPKVIIPDTPQLPDQPLGDPGGAIVVANAPSRVTPRAAPVISNQVIAAPEPDVVIDDVVQRQVAPDAQADAVEQDAQEETAPQETTTQVVTEADEPSQLAPRRSLRPGRKPAPPPQPVQTAQDPVDDPAPTLPGLEDLIEDAVQDANANNAVPDNANPGGGNSAPITRSEKSAFILSIRNCWNVGALSTDALQVTVVVSFSIGQDTKPDIGSIRLASAQGGVGTAVDRAYEAARRAIIRCGAGGFDLPLDKYDQWRTVEVKFNATEKDIR